MLELDWSAPMMTELTAYLGGPHRVPAAPATLQVPVRRSSTAE
jgi:hypothetical protein